jgi:serine/threonine protein kinase
MRCLACLSDDIPTDATTCPNCGQNLRMVLANTLPPNTELRSGSYRIDYALGRGGFGITYRAVHTALDTVVAIKEFFPEEQAGRGDEAYRVEAEQEQGETFKRGLERFYREGQLLARLTHPNIVRVTDLFRERGTAYLVMEYLQGQTLRQVLDTVRGRKLPHERAEVLIGRLVDALGELHSREIYHLDVSPENIVLMDDERPVLIDFGAARPASRNTMSTRQFRTDYAPIELVAGEALGPMTDIYELGVVAYEMLTGPRPPPGLSRLLGETWKMASLPGRWTELLDAALQVRPEDRPTDVRGWWGAPPPPPTMPRRRSPRTPARC